MQFFKFSELLPISALALPVAIGNADHSVVRRDAFGVLFYVSVFWCRASFFRHYDETKKLLKSRLSFCFIDDDGA